MDEEKSPDHSTGLRITGWIFYWIVESFGTIMMSMLWSVIGSVTNVSDAKTNFPLMIGISQIGAIGGATAATFSSKIGFPFFFLVQSIILMSIIALIRYTIKNGVNDKDNGERQQLSSLESVSESGMMEGINLIMKDSFVRQMAVVATFGEIVGVVVEYKMKVLARSVYSTGTSYAEFMGSYGQATNLVSLIFALTGSRWLLQLLGIRLCLIIFPVATLFISFTLFLKPTLMMAFLGIVLTKALSNSLNNPVKEMLYIDTTPDIRWKAKSWIDMFAMRAAKAVGSFFNAIISSPQNIFSPVGSAISSIMIIVWIRAAYNLGEKHHQKQIQSQTRELPFDVQQTNREYQQKSNELNELNYNRHKHTIQSASQNEEISVKPIAQSTITSTNVV